MRQMSRREMRFAKQHEDHGIRMMLPNFGDFGGSVPVASPNLSQIFSRHAVQAIKRVGVVACGDKQLVKRIPVVSPVQVETDALAKFILLNIPAPPFIKNVLVAGEDGFDAQNYRTIAHERTLLD